MKWIKVDGLDSLPPVDILVISRVVHMMPTRDEEVSVEAMRWFPTKGWVLISDRAEARQNFYSHPFEVTHWMLFPSI